MGIRRGDYIMFLNGNDKNPSWYIMHFKDKNRHCHIPCQHERKDKGRGMAIEIVKKAARGEIPKTFSNFMINCVNRLWFGQGFEKREDLVNDNLLLKDPLVRYKKKGGKHGNKGYVNLRAGRKQNN